MLSKISDWLDSTLQLNVPQEDEKHTTQLAAAVLLLEVSRADLDISNQEKQTIVSVLTGHFALLEDEANALLQYAIAEHDQYTSAHPFIL